MLYHTKNKGNQKKSKHIVVTNEVYEQLCNQGKVGDSFNDVVKKLLGKETTAPTNSNFKDKGRIQ